MIDIILCGVTGRMGQEIIKVLNNDQRFKLKALVVRAKSQHQLSNVSYIKFTELASFALSEVNNKTVIIDFSHFSQTKTIIEFAKKNNIALLVGTTKISAEDKNLCRNYSSIIPVLIAPNTSQGINILEQIFASLDEGIRKALTDWDVKIIDKHHKDKIDAPSGTALRLEETLRDTDILTSKHKDIHCTVRSGTIIGTHEVHFSKNSEELVFTHICTDRKIFALGALELVAWLVKQKPALYKVSDFLI